MKKLSKNFIILILIISIIFSFVSAFFINSEVQALSSSYTQYVTSGISSFPESYQKYLAYLKYLHPNWEFKAYYTGISWSEVTSSSAENKCLRNTIYKSSLVDPLVLCKCGQYGDSNYYCASAATVNYYLDPRNSLSEAMVFQFLDLSDGSEVSRDTVVSATSGTYLAQYVDYIMTAADEAGINPLHIVATIFQELGKSSTTPSAISGTYSGYEGYYNFYNYGATDGVGTAGAMAKAKEMGWNSAKTALIEGAKTVLANNYISAGQTTKYFYKFDVVGNEILTESMGSKTYSSSYFFSHQYMTNISDPSSQAGTLYTMYQDCNLLDENLTFIIPVYDDMPSSACSMPTSLSSSDGTLYYVSTINNYTLNLRTTAGGSTYLGKLYRGTIVAVTETSGSWSKVKVVSASSWSNKVWSGTSTTGWVATEYLTKVGTEIDDYRSLVDMGSSSSSSVSSADFEISGSYINMTPTTTVSTILAKYSSASVKNSSGTDITSSTGTLIGTGYKIVINGTTYTVVKYGDINGDGTIKASDYVLIKNHIMKSTTFTDVQSKAADVNKDGSIKASDYVLIKNYIMYGTNINL